MDIEAVTSEYGVLIRKAIEARKKAYVPYSKFKVGAALKAKNGSIYTGANLENAAYSPGICAERAAFFHGVKEGERHFRAIAVVGGMMGCGGSVLSEAGARSLDEDAAGVADYVFPCGVCRQVMAEFCGPDFIVIAVRSVRDYRIITLKELFPEAFGPGSLKAGAL